MMEGLDDHPDLLADEKGDGRRSDTVDLSTDSSLVVDISDSLSEKDKVKFTVHTKTTLPEFRQSEFSVVRQHEEFIWLRESYIENDDYLGYIIPPPPPKPDFDASREKLQKLGEGESTMTKEEFNKMKAELEAEYLATFKKTVAMHETFLSRLASHPILRTDHNFRVFLEYYQDLSVRGKNKKEKLGGVFRALHKSVDEVLLSSQKDVDEFFEHEKNFLVEYHNRVKEATRASDRMTRTHKNCSEGYIKFSSGLNQLATLDAGSDYEKYLLQVSECIEKARKFETRVASDQDLKQSDLFRYYMRESEAAKNLLYRRTRTLANYEDANKNLEKARSKNKDVGLAENTQQQACDRFEKISDLSKQELNDFKLRRVQAFRKNLIELAELEVKHSKAQVTLLKSCIESLKTQ